MKNLSKSNEYPILLKEIKKRIRASQAFIHESPIGLPAFSR
jgi:hypothetical protein